MLRRDGDTRPGSHLAQARISRNSFRNKVVAQRTHFLEILIQIKCPSTTVTSNPTSTRTTERQQLKKHAPLYAQHSPLELGHPPPRTISRPRTRQCPRAHEARSLRLACERLKGDQREVSLPPTAYFRRSKQEFLCIIVKFPRIFPESENEADPLIS